MVSLEQVQLLESKVAHTIEYVSKLSAENAALAAEKASLISKLDAYQKRIDELEVLVMRFKEDQSRIEDGIIAALDRLNQFEEAVEKQLGKSREERAERKEESRESGVGSREKAAEEAPSTLSAAGGMVPGALPSAGGMVPGTLPTAGARHLSAPEEKEVYFEIPEAEAEDEIDGQDDDVEAPGGLDIF